jgi:Fe-S-cluster containining protein
MEPDPSSDQQKTEIRVRKAPDCLTFQCSDQCCRYGVDVETDEYRALIEHRLATSEEFTGPEEDEGVWLYRTALGPRGCIFLLPERGCRLHNTEFKPAVCQIFPRDREEAREAFEDGYLPCVRAEFAGGNGHRRKRRNTERERIPV